MITANQYFNRVRVPGQPPVSTWQGYRLLVLIPELTMKLIPEQGYEIETLPLKAYVNHGYWRVKCECGGSEFAWEEEFFMCRSCLNAKHGHRYRRAVFPDNRKKIEEILIKRPLENRNWYPGETLSQLRKENQKHKEELLS